MPDFYDADDRHILYILVRKDMANSHVAVQASHAALEHGMAWGMSKHPSLCLLEVEGEGHLDCILDDLGSGEWAGHEFTPFFENAGRYADQLTAIAVGPYHMGDDRREAFVDLQLYKGRNPR